MFDYSAVGACCCSKWLLCKVIAVRDREDIISYLTTTVTLNTNWSSTRHPQRLQQPIYPQPLQIIQIIIFPHHAAVPFATAAACPWAKTP
jgi:hypothetical protein